MFNQENVAQFMVVDLGRVVSLKNVGAVIRVPGPGGAQRDRMTWQLFEVRASADGAPPAGGGIQLGFADEEALLRASEAAGAGASHLAMFELKEPADVRFLRFNFGRFRPIGAHGARVFHVFARGLRPVAALDSAMYKSYNSAKVPLGTEDARCKDVTKILNDLIGAGTLRNVTGGRQFNSVFGDVHLGKHKKLVIEKDQCLQEFGPDHPEHWGRLDLTEFFAQVSRGSSFRKLLTPRKGDSEIPTSSGGQSGAAAPPSNASPGTSSGAGAVPLPQMASKIKADMGIDDSFNLSQVAAQACSDLGIDTTGMGVKQQLEAAYASLYAG